MASDVQQGTIRTKIPARLDRLPWSPFHWRIVIGLGTVWILDGLEVTIVGSIASRLTEDGSGIDLGAGDIGLAAAIYVTGACIGALFFGQLTDRFGRKKLFMATLGVYLVATVATAFADSALYFFVCRFFTGAGIGGEYAAINSAIDELIPARNRGQVDLTINGSYWVGAAIGAIAAIFLLNTDIFAADLGWRLAFGMGGILGIAILIVRRHVPESPRWLFIHGKEDEAERIVDSIEADVREETGQELPEPDTEMTVRQRKTIPFREIAKVAFKYYPKRSVLGLSLFVGQAFIYNAVTFDLGTILSTFFGVASGSVPYFFAIFALGNFMGPLLLGRLFDTVGRKPMIAGTYLLSAALTAGLAILLLGDGLTRWSFIAVVGVTFFFASAGASSAYLTVSEIFPMETRALAIAFFYAIGTAIGGITGPLLFGRLIESGNAETVAIGFFVGAAVMAVGGIVELIYGVKAEQTPLEDIAKPLTAEDAERADAIPAAAGEEEGDESDLTPEHRAELECRQRAEEERARAAEHRAATHELRPRADAGDQRAAARMQVEEVLAEIADHRAAGFDEKAGAHSERAAAETADDEGERAAAGQRAEAAEERARVNYERAEALAAEHHADAEMHAALAEAAAERARAREQRAEAEKATAQANELAGAEADVARARTELHERWAQMHEERAQAHAARADGDTRAADRHESEARALEELGRAAEERVQAARHLAAAADLREQEGAIEQTQQELERAAEREREAREREERIRARLERQRSGRRRFRLGPGSTYYSPGMLGTSSRWTPSSDEELDREIDVIARALDERGATDREDLASAVGARYWGPGRFRAALREAVDEGRVRRVSRNTYAPQDGARR
jgi:MFS family permease